MSFDRSSLLAGRTVIVAGGAGALGRSFCEDIAAAGGFPVVADRDVDQARTVAGAIGAGRAGAVALDVTSSVSVEAMIAEVHEKHGPIYAIVNSAYPRNKQYGRKFEEVTYEDFSENMSQHVGGIFLLSQRFASYLERSGFRGAIINIASIYGVLAPRFEIYDDTSMTMPVEYAAIKSAVIHLTKYMAKYFFNKNIRVNCISPGGILANQPDTFISNYRGYCASRGMLGKHDISGTLIFLLSDLSEFINGQNVVVDDGFSL